MSADAEARKIALPARDYVRGVLAGDRAMLARAITLIESTRPEHVALAQDVLAGVFSHTGTSLRIGISGTPGVGKSTFIERFGQLVIEAGHQVAVLAVDPTSPTTGGSVLGDKTRMPVLAQSSRAFVRPSPTVGTLGGVARRTREALLLCEAAGFDVVIVETVGVGQSETAVAGMVDFLLVLLLSTSGDELQGIKRGILELADLIAINKADAEAPAIVTRALADYRHAMRIVRGDEPGASDARVVACSGLTGTGLDAIWRAAQAVRQASEAFTARRRRQLIDWLWSAADASLLAAFHQAPHVAAARAAVEAAVLDGRLTPTAGAASLVELFGAALRPTIEGS